MSKYLFVISIFLFTSYIVPGFSATSINLAHQPIATLGAHEQIKAVQLNKETDFNQVTHLRMQQTYAGYPVWGADFVIHGKAETNSSLAEIGHNKATANGIIYQELAADLQQTPQYIFNPQQAQKAQQYVEQIYQHQTGNQQKFNNLSAKLMVYVDKAEHAHWAYLITGFVATATALPAQPSYILDALTFKIYQSWNNIQTLSEAEGGGLGGNEKIGKIIYDGLPHDLSKLAILRDTKKQLCYLKNKEVTVLDQRSEDAVATFVCKNPTAEHNNVFWDADLDQVNGAYSPSNDALFVGKMVKNMYRDWYQLPVLVKNNIPMMLTMRVHAAMENAYWDGEKMTFGDGMTYFYPLVSLGVAAHEISHGFTEQHAGLVYSGQSGGLNESFSDMAAQAIEYYVLNKNSWQIGAEIIKQKNKSIRYMDEPTRDCSGNLPGQACSISHFKDYSPTLNVHFSSGIFNKIFYLMSTAQDWNTRKAFNVMVQANRYYWTATTTFAAAACGVLSATQDYHYNSAAVKHALQVVGLEVEKICH